MTTSSSSTPGVSTGTVVGVVSVLVLPRSGERCATRDGRSPSLSLHCSRKPALLIPHPDTIPTRSRPLLSLQLLQMPTHRWWSTSPRSYAASPTSSKHLPTRHLTTRSTRSHRWARADTRCTTQTHLLALHQLLHSCVRKTTTTRRSNHTRTSRTSLSS